MEDDKLRRVKSPIIDQLGTALGSAYTIERELEGGGMARVFLAQEAALGRPVVIDAPFSPYLSDPNFITAVADRFHWPPVDVEVLRVRVSPATLQHRLRERGLERDAYKLAHWDEYWATHGGQACAWTGVRLSELSNDSDEAEFPLDRRSTQAL